MMSGLLRQHRIRRLEVFPRIRNKLRVARMIDGFDTDDDVHELRNVVMYVVDQLFFCVRRPRNKSLTRVSDRLGGRLQIVGVGRGMPTADAVCSVVDMPGRMIRAQDEQFNVGCVEMENARLAVINPNDGVKMRFGHETPLPKKRRRLLDIIESVSARHAMDQSHAEPVDRVTLRRSGRRDYSEAPGQVRNAECAN